MNRGRHWNKHEVEEMARAEAIGRQGEPRKAELFLAEI